MFGGAPPKPSAAETARLRLEAQRTLRTFFVYSAGLYVAPWGLAYLGRLLSAN